MRLDLPVKDWQFLKSTGRWTLPLAIIAAGVSGVGIYTVYQQTRVQPQVVEVPVVTTPEIALVTALGRLEPQGEVIKVSSSSSIEGSRVAQVLVKQGDRVQAGQIVAILDSRDRLQAGLEQAKQDVRVAEANLAKIKAGAKAGEISAQTAEIGRLQAQLTGEIGARTAEVNRLQDQLEGERKTQQATIARWIAQQQGDRNSQRAEIARLVAQLEGEQKTQTAAIARLSAQQQNAQSEFARYQQLSRSGAIAASLLDSKRLQLETTSQQLTEGRANLSQTQATLTEQINEARANLQRTETTLTQQINEARANLRRTEATLTQQIKEAQANRDKTINTINEQIRQARGTLNQIAEVRPTDVNAAQAEIERAKAGVRKAQADLDQAFVRSPINGQVLKIHTKAGETVSSAGGNSSNSSNSGGIVDIGQTGQMYAIAEVYESDIAKVKVGQAATIASETNTFEGELKGTVAEVGLQIGKKDILNTDPAADVDARVVEVKIQLDPESSSKVSGLTYSKVIAKIILDPAPTEIKSQNDQNRRGAEDAEAEKRDK